jgi:CRP/FNR family transcriptional regulator, cyclic AMP receptor protein
VSDPGLARLGDELNDDATPSVLILREDPDLGQGLSDVDRRAAFSLFRTRVIHVPGPTWEPPELDRGSSFGLLVLDGLLGRRVKIGRTVGTELLSYGDIIRPADEPPMWEMIPAQLDWRVFTPARLAVLDERITALVGRRPQLLVNFSERLLRRARAASYLMVASHLPRVEDRVLATLWHLASCWGRVTADGVCIPFRLTHELLGEIVGAHRPSVTVAMQTLQSRGLLLRRDDGRYCLVGEPPEWRSSQAEASDGQSMRAI